MNKVNQRWFSPSTLRLFSMLVVALSFIVLIQTYSAGASVRIINGERATDGEFPWHVFVGVPVQKGGEIELGQCGGTLITLEWVLTAAHCFDDIVNNEDVYVGAGGVGWGGEPASSQYWQSNRTSQIYIHPQYNQDGNNSDIALIKLSSPFRDTQNVSTIPLAESLPNAGISLTIVGWGITEDSTLSGNFLLKAETIIEQQGDCNKEIEDIRTLFCSDFRNSGAGGCIGDSGGGAVNLNGTSPRLVGVISHGYNNTGNPCIDTSENYNTYYVNLSLYLDWIEQVMEIDTASVVSPELCIDLQGERFAGMDEPIAYTLIGELIGTITIRTMAEIKDADTGCFDAVSVPPGTYDVVFRSDNLNTDYLTNVVHAVRFRSNGNTIILQENGKKAVLIEGDANSDDSVTPADSSILASSLDLFSHLCEGDANYDARADFNEDGCVTPADSSLIVSNLDLFIPRTGDTYSY